MHLHLVIDVEVLNLTDASIGGVQDSLLAEFMVWRAGMLVALEPDQVHGDLHSLRRLHTVWGQEPSGRKDGQLPATLRAEGGTHRPCDNCSNIGLVHAQAAFSGMDRCS